MRVLNNNDTTHSNPISSIGLAVTGGITNQVFSRQEATYLEREFHALY